MRLKTSLFGAGLFTIFFAVGLSAGATEYFVGRQGNDGNDGATKEKAFLTIQKGVDALKTGDTLTIAPGEYSERVKRDNLGGAGTDTVIRAEIPGTVLLRGDVAAPEFKPVEGYHYVYSAQFDREAQAVNEVDTLTIMETVPNVMELEFTPGACFYDIGQKKLYVSTSDMQPPGMHHYTVSVIKNFGLFLHQPERVVVEGIAVTGFHSSEKRAGQPGEYAIFGMMLVGGKQCVIRQCTAFLNAGGISANSGHFSTYKTDTNQIPGYGLVDTNITDHAKGPGGNLIEECRAYANYSRHSYSGGNIIIFNSDNDTIRNCESHSSARHGMHHYGDIHGPAIMSNNLSWGNVINDIQIKGGTKDGVYGGFGLAERCVTLGPIHVVNVKHCMIGRENQFNSSPGADNFRYDLEAAATRDREFADPDNLDFRLQADSKFRGAAPDGSDRGPFPYETNIFYVKPGGDDQADGLSMGKAWKTLERALKNLRSGDTLYLDGGVYDANLELKAGRPGDKPVAIRGRGTAPVVIRGTLAITKSHAVAFERLNFTGSVAIRGSRNISFNNGSFNTIQSKAVNGLKITHCVFTGFGQAALELTACSSVFLSGNIFDNHQGPALKLDRVDGVRYSDYNSYRNPGSAWEVNGKTIALAELQEQHDRYSLVLTPKFQVENGAPFLENQEKFSAGGPNGTALGVYREFKEKVVRVSAPTAYSVTPTTANLEWWTSLPARCDVAWGETPECTNRSQFNADGECTNRSQFNADGFGSFSLVGLKPGTKYYFKIIEAKPLANPSDYCSIATTMSPPSSGAHASQQANSGKAPLAFATATSMAAPAVYYVAPDGNDRNSGLSREKALRTVTRAANQANAGDTVLIAGGVYKETVRIRATGLPGRPITFKSLPGKKVIFDGDNQTMARAFMASGKHHLRFDGLYFRYFAPGTRTSGILCLYQCDGVQITRCFKDGRYGYSPSFVMARGCNDLTIRNCAIISATYGGLYMARCPDALIENNVLLRSLIIECIFGNLPSEKVRLAKNIITDNVPHKLKACLVEIGSFESFEEQDNCYYLRVPVQERDNLFMIFGQLAKPPMFKNMTLMGLLDFQKKSGNTSSFAANPGFKATADMKAVDKDGKPIFLVDQLMDKKDLDFPDLFATDPEVVKRGIGLQPEAFKDFNFSPVDPGAKPGP